MFFPVRGLPITWSAEENHDLLRAFYYAKEKNLPLVNGTYEVWRKLHPDTLPHFDPNWLATQHRVVVKQATTAEVDSIIAELRKAITEESQPSENKPQVHQVASEPDKNQAMYENRKNIIIQTITQMS